MDSAQVNDIPSLPYPDHLHLQSAEGWLMLGNPTESEAELHRISSPLQKHPDVLELRWLIIARSQRWNDCLAIAREIVAVVPSRPFGWIHLAYSLRRVEGEGLRTAWDALLPALARFQDNLTIPYNLSCYACQLGNLPEARRLLTQAFNIARGLGNQEAIRSLALADSDLEDLWSEIRAW